MTREERHELFEQRLSANPIWSEFKAKWYGNEPRKNSKAYKQYEVDHEAATAVHGQIYREVFTESK